MTMYDRWVKAAAAGQVSGAVLLDLSAAFDLVDPQIIVQKLRIYGVESDFLCWIESYLTLRYQAVWLDHVLSDFAHCEIGVPQGSILGPLFFLIFFSDLPHELDSQVDNYADDTTVSCTARSVEEIGVILSKDCQKISNWMRSNKLKLNPEKTHILTIGTAERLRKLPQLVQVTMDNITLQEDSGKSEVLLGCHIQGNLKWESQVKVLLQKLRNRLLGLGALRYIAPFNVRKQVAEGIFTSVLVYCLPVYGGLDKGDLKDIQVLQNKAAQVVTHSPPLAERSPMYDKLNWLTVNQLITYHTVISVFKIRKNLEPEYLASMLTKDSRNRRIMIPNIDLGLAQKSFTMRGSESWNKLPENIRNQSKISIFKKMVKKWISLNIPKFKE